MRLSSRLLIRLHRVLPAGASDRIVLVLFRVREVLTYRWHRWRCRKTVVMAGSDVGRIFWRVAPPAPLFPRQGRAEIKARE